ncbi:copine-3-like isoform X2 [Mizuhopecten yessoensis]|uniref:copine-3-like isoform X2 n=1 Tax=Mizuhopecten yessoensis TaxID=6573 RepID=UPI000B45C08D|nr:copine-3-like isoform X2 [Mizuhopecten yessoensis]
MAADLDTMLTSLRGMKVELMISCTDLVDLDTMTKSDPMCVLFVKSMGKWVEYDRTESIKNTLNPKFEKSFVIEFDPRTYHYLRFSVYDIDYNNAKLELQDYVGCVDLNFMDIVSTKDALYTCNKILRVQESSKPRGTISITSELMTETRDIVNIHVAAHKLDKSKGMFSKKNDIYLEISKELSRDSGNYQPVYRSDVYPKSNKPRWRPFSFNLQKLCNNDWTRNLKISCYRVVYQEGASQKFELIGQVPTTLAELHNKDTAKTDSFINLPLKNPKDQSKHKWDLRIIKFRVDRQHSLIDYLRGGLHLNLMIAIDFTASNGSLNDIHSLHNIRDLDANPYLHTLETIGRVISDFNFDRKLALYGFGAKWNDKEYPSHCFPLSGDKTAPYMRDIEDVIQKYKEILPVLTFSGPTMLAPIIDRAVALEESQNTSKEHQVYTVLLVITDGVINDMNNVMKRLIEKSHRALSVVFVGVGPADFSLMEHFSDNTGFLKLEKTGRLSERQNTHFLPYRKDVEEPERDMMMKRDVMTVLSKHVLQFYKNVEPNKPRLRRHDQLNSVPWEAILATPHVEGRDNLTRSKSRISIMTVKDTKPMCPTCGASIDVSKTGRTHTSH